VLGEGRSAGGVICKPGQGLGDAQHGYIKAIFAAATGQGLRSHVGSGAAPVGV
jgi:hypothetical protein